MRNQPWDARPAPTGPLALATAQLRANKVTAFRAIQAQERAKVLQEITGKARNRVYAYRKHLAALGEDTEALRE